MRPHVELIQQRIFAGIPRTSRGHGKGNAKKSLLDEGKMDLVQQK
ncbi:MAG: hypothetical protein Ct9H90mP13_03220 [Pseudomonadota bacterium]|nr:MAG: hypothetical protein Ct9H90mP13_03220 [Pseudomonadota bacterium]